MSGDGPHQIFLSHASEDKVAVRVLNERLKTDGYATWLDEESILPGQDWAEEISAAVRDSDIMLVCLSPASTVKRGYVHREIELALDVAQSRPKGAIFVIPVRLQPCDIPEQLDKWQWVDLSDNGYERLLFALNQHLLRQKPVRERFLAAMTNRIGFCSEALNWAKERQQQACPLGSTVDLTEQLVSRAQTCPREMKGASELLYAELGECLSKLTGLIDDSFLKQQAPLKEEIDDKARMIEYLNYEVKTIGKEREAAGGAAGNIGCAGFVLAFAFAPFSNWLMILVFVAFATVLACSWAFLRKTVVKRRTIGRLETLSQQVREEESKKADLEKRLAAACDEYRRFVSWRESLTTRAPSWP